ncbi:unnamed protein product, partial [Rotaria sp. Silwood2]
MFNSVQTTQQPQTITIPAGALQLGGNGQQIVQLSTPTKTQSSAQNGTVIMMVPGNAVDVGDPLVLRIILIRRKNNIYIYN